MDKIEEITPEELLAEYSKGDSIRQDEEGNLVIKDELPESKEVENE